MIRALHRGRLTMTTLRVVVVPLMLMAVAALAQAFLVMMFMSTFTTRELMIVAVGHLRTTAITVHLAAE